MIGVLALQGNYEMHCKMLDCIGEKNIFVKNIKDLNCCDGLIIPGGESTVISKMMNRYNLFNSIKKFAEKKSVFGTCAGLILMTDYNSEDVKGLNILDVCISRNAWGRQVHSFTDKIEINIYNKYKNFKATFIRAPKINKINKSVKPLSYIGEEVVMVHI